MKNLYFFKFFCFSLLLASCCVGPKYFPPEVEMPRTWCRQPAAGMDSSISSDSINWWEALNDPILTSLIAQASEQNLDLHLALLHIIEARAEHKAKGADALPHVDASFTGGHLYHNKKALLNKFLDSSKHQRNFNFFELGFDADWEIDLFGKTAHELKALAAKVEATEETFYDVWVTLSAEIARNYIELRLAQKRLGLLHEHIRAQQETVHLTNQLLGIGSSSRIDFRQTEEQLHFLQARAPQIELSIEKSIHCLSKLLGKHPGALAEELCQEQPLPLVPFHQPIGVPSDLLRRRPDIRRAERKLASATEYVGSAIASLFPSFSLKGFVGNINSHFPSLFSPQSYSLFFAPQLLAPIFNSKMLKYDVEYTKLKVQEAYYEYHKAVLNALEEAENALAAFHWEIERNDRLLLAFEANEEAKILAADLYQNGFKSYLELLVLERSYLETEEAFIQGQADLLFHYISLYKALGGGFFSCENCH
ncbi:putative outer membrane protein of AcrAB(MexAB)-OprM multidrug efflux pump [Chlamydiales bacterium STE3]|nr:putative outer membrane protein of AcrAB(MexAB)-OprM multidrug efflux pump [Chlamydiales bacterium STE3]